MYNVYITLFRTAKKLCQSWRPMAANFLSLWPPVSIFWNLGRFCPP